MSIGSESVRRGIRTGRIILAGFLCLVPFLEALQGSGLQGIRPPVQYSEVVARAFDFEGDIPFEHRIVLRLVPSAVLPESQVVFLRQSGGTIRVIQYRLKDPKQPLSQVYEEMTRRNPGVDLEEILKQVPVQKSERIATRSEAKLVADFLTVSIPTKMSTDLCMDGTTYYVWVHTLSNQVHASLSSCAFDPDSGSVAIMRWIRKTQAAFRMSMLPQQ
jgi:hypothetical protein